MSDPLTLIERRVYHYLIDYLARHTYQPSVREIAPLSHSEYEERGRDH